VIAEAFMVCALALPLANVPHGDSGGHHNPDTAEAFIHEYNWLKELLERSYPGNEFLIIPVEYEETPPGWDWTPVGWRGHLIYRRPIERSA
jgi:hypothetical protein